MSIFKTYLRQPSTWLGLAKIGAAAGIYSMDISGAVSTAIISLFGLIDVIRNESRKPQL